MRSPTVSSRSVFWTTLHGMAMSLAMVTPPASADDVRAQALATSGLVGTWQLVAADLLAPDGSRRHDYGPAPEGLLVVDAEGRYSLQIYARDRPRFAAGDKARGTPAEFEAALMGCSTHFGTLDVDPAARTMTLHVQRSSYPNQDGSVQVRNYALEDDRLSYRVQARADGNIPISEWRRVR